MLIIDYETDLGVCLRCGAIALHWQIGGHECEATVYGEAKGIIAGDVLGRLGTIEPEIIEATARAYWRYLVRTGNRFDLAEAVNMYEGDTARAFVRKSVWDYLLVYGTVENV